MTPNEFIAKWRKGGAERAEAQSFFNDLCHLVGHKTPREADPDKTWFAFEYGAEKTHGGKGFADAWLKGKFGWEAKGTSRSLQDAYAQLKMYADDLQNPPLLVVCDLQTFEIHTNFTNTVKEVHRFTVDDLIKPEVLRKVRAMFYSPEDLRPDVKKSDITAEAAKKFASLAHALRERNHPPLEVAHFLNRLVFCMFAEDINLLPDGLFTRMVEGSQDDPDAFQTNAQSLFSAMRKGGVAGFTKVEWFNGGLFDDDTALPLTVDELRTLLAACKLHWDQIDPSIFGTLFERGLDPKNRAKLGAHYTDPATIQKIIKPVVVEPLLAEWDLIKEELAAALAKDKTKTKISKAIETKYYGFLERLTRFVVLDPACGSGNFLYLSLLALKDVEARVIFEAESLGFPRQQPSVGPANVRGIELNEYAAELARITVWIGEIQWMIQNGYGARKNPILQPLDQIECRDALINKDDTEASWPDADAVVGNPPFIGNKRMNRELGGDYLAPVRAAYEGRVSAGADFVCFWLEKANDGVSEGRYQRVGLVSTNSIRSGANREVLKHAVATTRIFDAWSDEEWWDTGTAVRVSLVCFGHSTQGARLDGNDVIEIYADLKGRTEAEGVDVTEAKALPRNARVSFQGIIPRAEIKKKRRLELGIPEASFNLDGELGREILSGRNTLDGEPQSAVVRPYWIADDITSRHLDRYIIDFGGRTEAQASMFERQFEEIQNVRLNREQMLERDDKNDRLHWWLFSRSRPKFFGAVKPLSRYIAIPRHAKHFLVVWMDKAVVPDSALVMIARDDDTALGLLQSRIHEVWARRQGSSIGIGNDPRYTPGSCFETFPFPEGLQPDVSPADQAKHPQAASIAAAARALVEARDKWLHPADRVEWEQTEAEEKAGFPARPVPMRGHEEEVAKLTLTNLYNKMPVWLKELHGNLDREVAKAYGWEWPITDAEILRRLLELNKAA